MKNEAQNILSIEFGDHDLVARGPKEFEAEAVCRKRPFTVAHLTLGKEGRGSLIESKRAGRRLRPNCAGGSAGDPDLLGRDHAQRFTLEQMIAA